MSRSALRSSKASGDAIEADIVQVVDELDPVDDSVATWHDAETATLLEPDQTLPLVGVVVVERGTPIEIKATQYRTSNGSGDTWGRIYVKRPAHERLLAEAGMYLLVVYVPRPGLPQCARVVVPASIMDELLTDRWYDVDGQRSEDEVAKLGWQHVLDPDAVDPNGGILNER